MGDMDIMWLYPEVVSVDLKGSSRKLKMYSDHRLRNTVLFAGPFVFHNSATLPKPKLPY